MGQDFIPYDPYHPHLGYTLAIVCLAWLSITIYNKLFLQQRPSTRVVLQILAIGLMLYAEGVSFAIHHLRPAPDTLIGYHLSHFHAFVLQSYPIDTFLSTPTNWLVLAMLFTIAAGALIRLAYGTYQLNRLLAGAVPITETSYAPQVAQLAAVVGVAEGQLLPIMVIDHDAPLAFTAGIVRPRIYVAAMLLDLLAPDETLAVLCHEWAHTLRHDTMWNMAARLLRDLSWFLPSSHLAWRALLASQEEACDTLAAQLTTQPLALARALIKVAAAWGHRHEPDLVVARSFSLAGPHPRERIAQLIRLSEEPPVGGRAPVIGAYLLAALLLLLSTLPALLGS